MELTLTPEAKQAIETHAIATYPNECCGFMYGQDDGKRIISLAKDVVNSKEGDQRRRFVIAPIDYMKAEQYALDNNLSLLGIFHSHPEHPALPSEHDRVQAQPYFSYIIVSVKSKEIADIRSWRLNDQQTFDEEKILY